LKISRDTLSTQNRAAGKLPTYFSRSLSRYPITAARKLDRMNSARQRVKKGGKSTSSGCSFFRPFIVGKTSLALNVALTGRGYLLLPASSPGGKSLSWGTLGEKVFTSVLGRAAKKSRYIILRERFALERLSFPLFLPLLFITVCYFTV